MENKVKHMDELIEEIDLRFELLGYKEEILKELKEIKKNKGKDE